jgi:hypothetical protein
VITYEVVPADVADEILRGPQLIHHLPDEHRRPAQHLVGGHESVNFLEGLQAVDPDVEHPPVRAAQELPQLVLDQAPAGKAGNGAGEALPLRPSEGVLDPQAQLLDVEGLGDVIVGAQLQPGDAVAALVPLGEEQDGDVTGAQVSAQAAAHLVAVDVREDDVQEDQVGELLPRSLQRLLAPRSRLDLVVQGGEVGLQQVGDVGIIFHDQNPPFAHRVLPHAQKPHGSIPRRPAPSPLRTQGVGTGASELKNRNGEVPGCRLG